MFFSVYSNFLEKYREFPIENAYFEPLLLAPPPPHPKYAPKTDTIIETHIIGKSMTNTFVTPQKYKYIQIYNALTISYIYLYGYLSYLHTKCNRKILRKKN